MQGRSKRSGWSGFGRTTIYISQGKNKIPFYKKQVIDKSTRVIFGLVQLVTLRYNRQKKHNDEVDNNRTPTHAKFSCSIMYYIVQNLNNKQSAKVICRFERLRVSHSKIQKVLQALESCRISMH